MYLGVEGESKMQFESEEEFNSTLTFGIEPGIHYDVLYLAQLDLIIAMNGKVTSEDCQKAANFFLKLVDQKQRLGITDLKKAGA